MNSRWSPNFPRLKAALQVRKHSDKSHFPHWVVHRELVPQGETVNVDFYCTVLRRLTEKFQLRKLEVPLCAGSQRAVKTEEFVGCANTIFTHNPDH